MPCFGICVYVGLHPHPFCSSISKIITPHTDLQAIIRARVLLRWGTSPLRPLTFCEWQIKSQVCRISWTFLLICSRGRKERMKDSENKGKGPTAQGRLKDLGMKCHFTDMVSLYWWPTLNYCVYLFLKFWLCNKHDFFFFLNDWLLVSKYCVIQFSISLLPNRTIFLQSSFNLGWITHISILQIFL